MKISKEKVTPFFQEVFSHLSRRLDIPVETLMKLELSGFLKIPPIIDFVLDCAFFEEFRQFRGRYTVDEVLQHTGEKFSVPSYRVANAIKRMGHELPSKAE